MTKVEYEAIDQCIEENIAKIRKLKNLIQQDPDTRAYSMGKLKVLEDTLFELRKSYQAYALIDNSNPE